MKKMLLLAAILCGASVLADSDPIEYQMLYWQVGNGYRADDAVGARMYATLSEGGTHINIGGSKPGRGQATGFINKSDFSSLTFDKNQAIYFFELFAADGLILSTSQGFSYTDLLAANAFDITYAGMMDAPIVHSQPFTAYAMIPEPTSGLLMLLGLAGLALRRKRA